MFKAQVSLPGPNKHEWSATWDGWMPGWHTFKTGSRETCGAAVAQYLSSGGESATRVVVASKRDNED